MSISQEHILGDLENPMNDILLNFCYLDNLLMISVVSLCLCLGLWSRAKQYSNNNYIPLILGLILILVLKSSQKVYFINFDDKLLVTLVQLLLVIFLSYLLILQQDKQGTKMRFESPILLTIALFGILLTLENTEGLVIFLGLEIQSFIFYTLITLNEQNISSAEGSLKYFLLGALASGLFILGLGLIYGITGQTDFANISEILAPKNSLILLGCISISLGILFKIGAAPFHFWLPDAYEGAPYYVLLFLLSLPKVSFFYLLFNINNMFNMRHLMLLTIILSAVIGSLEALEQVKTKRFIAYTIISNNCFFLSILLITGKAAYYSLLESLMLYLIICILMVLVFSGLKNAENGKYITSLRDLVLLKKHNVFLAISLMMLFFSAAGIPPLVGFFQKYILLLNLIEQQQIFMVMFLIVVSILPAYYYLRMTKSIYFISSGKSLLLLPITKNISLFVALGTWFTLSAYY